MMFEEFQRPLVDVATQPPDTNSWINDTLFRESAADQQRALEGANQIGDVAQQAHIAENANNQQQFVQGIAAGMKQAERFAPPLTSTEPKTNNDTFAGSLSTVGDNPSEDTSEPVPTSEQIAQQKQAIAQAIPLTQEMYYKNLLGDYDMSSTDYYKQQYDAIRKAGYSWRIAKEVAGERAQLYQQQRLNQLGRQFVNEGTNGLAVNGVGAQLLNEMQAENPQSVGVLAKMFASPMQQWDYIGKTDMQNARFQHQDALAQYQAQVRQALQNQRLAQQFELAAYKFQLADAAKQREYVAKAQTLMMDNPNMSQEEAFTRAMAGAGGRGSSSSGETTSKNEKKLSKAEEAIANIAHSYFSDLQDAINEYAAAGGAMGGADPMKIRDAMDRLQKYVSSDEMRKLDVEDRGYLYDLALAGNFLMNKALGVEGDGNSAADAEMKETLTQLANYSDADLVRALTAGYDLSPYITEENEYRRDLLYPKNENNEDEE